MNTKKRLLSMACAHALLMGSLCFGAAENTPEEMCANAAYTPEELQLARKLEFKSVQDMRSKIGCLKVEEMLAEMGEPEAIVVPADCFSLILGTLDVSSFGKAAQVCHGWRAVANDPVLKTKILLKKHGGDVDDALLYAVENNLDWAIPYLKEKGANVNAKHYPTEYLPAKETLLMIAADNRSTKAVKELLKAGADVNAKNAIGTTALMKAVRVRDPEAVEALIAAGADVNAKSDFNDTVLIIATRDGQAEIIKLLEAAGAK